ncbi:MAG: glycosyltransferase family 2 protein [Chloroflexia bacterium]|nr:glycosyltransferase family 2 protein [Chloroflexia bacterium]
MATLATIVTAYRTARWVGECLNGFYGQEPCPGWDYELYLGVDACPNTAEAITQGGWTYWLSEQNVGTYVLSNSLMALCRHADLVLRFDSDDVPLPHLLKTLITNSRNGLPAPGTTVSCGPDLVPDGQVKVSPGVTAWPRHWLDKLGGFQPDRVDCDADLFSRAKLAGCDMGRAKAIAMASGGNYLRRRHPDSLSRCPETAIRSAYREEIRARHVRGRRAKIYRVTPVTTPLIEHPGTRPFFR